jgi:hypothetical protein
VPEEAIPHLEDRGFGRGSFLNHSAQVERSWGERDHQGGLFMTGMEQNSRKASQRLAGGDALFVGGLVVVFSGLCPGFGRIGLAIGLLLFMAGGWFFLQARKQTKILPNEQS